MPNKKSSYDDKIAKAQLKVEQTKAKYEEALEELKRLQNESETEDAMYEQLYKGDKGYDEIMALLNSEDGNQ